MVIDPVNLLAPSSALMLGTLAALSVVVVGVIYLFVRLVRVMSRTPGPTAADPRGLAERAGRLEATVEELTTDVAEIREAQQFTDALLTARLLSANARASSIESTDT